MNRAPTAAPPSVHPRVGTNQDSVRRHNLAVLLGHLHRDGQLSRAELTQRMGLGRSTIGALVGELEALGLVLERPPEGDRSGVGRPSHDVHPNESRVLALAAKVGEDELLTATVGIGGTVQARMKAPTPRSHRPTAVVAALVEMFRGMIEPLPDTSALMGIGVGIPGMVSADGTVRFASNLGWKNVRLPELLRKQIPEPLPLYVAHDVNFGALGEHVRGAGMGHEDMVYVGCDIGLGAGIRVGGQALTGAGGYAGELGHLVINPGGRLCRCGSRGCWETEVNAGAIAAALGLRGKGRRSLSAALAAIREPPAALRSIGRYLGMGLGNIVNTFNPEVIILGGILREVYPVIHEFADRAMHQVALDGPGDEVRVVLPNLGKDAVLVGAAERVFEAILADPAGELGRHLLKARARPGKSARTSPIPLARAGLSSVQRGARP